MNRKDYFNKFSSLGIESDEMERKWKIFQEEEALMHNMRMFEAIRAGDQSASSAVPMGGGNINPIFYAWATDGDVSGSLSLVDPSGNWTQVGSPFGGVAVFCKNLDNGLTYYIEQDFDEEEMVVGIIDLQTGGRVELIRNPSELSEYFFVPTSLTYIGNNNFLYLDNSPLFGSNEFPQHVFVIHISDDGEVSPGTPSIWDYNEEGLALTSLFFKDDVIYALCTPDGLPLGLVGKLNIEGMTLDDVNTLELEEYPLSESYKIWFSVGCTQASNGEIYINAIINDKNTEILHQSIIKFIGDNLYNCRYVQEASPAFEFDESEVFSLDIEAI
jgi:hypothetical protein